MLRSGLLHASLSLACLLLPTCRSDGRDQICDIGHDSAGRLRANCSSRGLRDFPTNLRTDIKVLWITSNDLVAPTWAVLESLPLLEELDLAHNRVERVAPRAVMPVLNLDASHNSLAELPPLNLLPGLTRLKINDNRIAALPAHAFAVVRDLQELFLGNNRLRAVDQNSFADMDALRILSLPGNGLQSVSADLMVSMSNLDVLDIAKNSLKSLPKGFFEPALLSYFYGYENPWICDCSVAYLWDWMHDGNDGTVYNSLLEEEIESIVCSDHGPHSGKPLYNLDKDSFCPATQDPNTNVAVPTLPVPVAKTTSGVVTTTAPSVPATVPAIQTVTFQKMTTAFSTTAEVTSAQVTAATSTIVTTLSTAKVTPTQVQDVPSTITTTLSTAKIPSTQATEVPTTVTTTVPATVEASTAAAPSSVLTSVKVTTRAASTERATTSRLATTTAQTSTRSFDQLTNASRVQTTLTTAPRPTTAASSSEPTQTHARSHTALEGETTTARADTTVEDEPARVAGSTAAPRWCLCQPEEATTTSRETRQEYPCRDRFPFRSTAGSWPDDSLSDAVADYMKGLVSPKCFRYGIFPWLLHLVHALLFLALVYCIVQLRRYLRAEPRGASSASRRARRVDRMPRRFQHEIINHPLNLRRVRMLPMGEGTLPSDESKPFVFRLRHVPDKDPGPEVSIVYF